jgi:hypothetical protein
MNAIQLAGGENDPSCYHSCYAIPYCWLRSNFAGRAH